MIEKSKSKILPSTTVWGVGLVVVIMVAALVHGFSHRYVAPQADAQASPSVTPMPVSNPQSSAGSKQPDSAAPTVADAQTDQAESNPPSDAPTSTIDPTNDSSKSISIGTTCYDSKPFLEHFNLTPETRSDFAEKLTKAMPDDNVTVSASGDGNQYLLFVSQPENISSLQEVFGVTNTPKTRANFCMQGFAEAQFIVINPDTSQTLLFKLPTSLDETLQYAAHHYAIPMQ